MSNVYSTIAIVPVNPIAAISSLECQVADLRAQAATAHANGLNEYAVRVNTRAAILQRALDIATDKREMRADGYTQAEIRVYIERTYGSDGPSLLKGKPDANLQKSIDFDNWLVKLSDKTPAQFRHELSAPDLNIA